MINSKKMLMKFSTYSIVGIVSVAFYFLSIFIFVELFHQEPVLSSALAFLLMTLISYFLNKRFTFNSASSKKTFIKYLAVSGLAFVLNSTIMYAVVYIFSYHYSIGEIVTTLIIPLINFILNNYWTFKEK
ncbi:GtrA family protein [Bacillus taeanensis]|uniref:GtrA family protein n=1 Tax=Bacillus taeanensis TaxID=273032 RepID=A0A366XRK3_9BACI|nr:GtrA family protein [Bacillus taeanensis]RBW68762.1 GtrA family protein [Bacillus taeanensis]